MKKLLAIMVLGLLWSGNAYSKIITLSNCFITESFTDGLANNSFSESVSTKHDLIINTSMGTVLEKTINRHGKGKQTTLRFNITHFDKNNIYAEARRSAETTIIVDINLKNNKVYWSVDGATNAYGQALDIWNIFQCEKINDKSDDTEIAKSSSGTAFFISNNGYLLTNNHVVEGCKAQKINYFNKEYHAQIIAVDKNLDLALLKVDAKNKNYINFSKSDIEKLQKIYVAGYPFGKGLSDDLKISSGIISSNKGFEDNSNEFQIDAPINPGNSGGPIVNDTGELVGIAVAGFAKDKSEGINFGIKSSTAINFLKTNKVKPGSSYMTFAMNNKKLLRLLEESTVYTFCK